MGLLHKCLEFAQRAAFSQAGCNRHRGTWLTKTVDNMELEFETIVLLSPDRAISVKGERQFYELEIISHLPFSKPYLMEARYKE